LWAYWSGCQAGAYFDNEVIPPGAPRPKLPWAYTYAQFDALLVAYPDVHQEDFVTYGILQAQPRWGSHREWGEVAGVLSHMVGGKRILANELSVIIHRIQRLERDDPMRVTEETTLVDVVMRERPRSRVPLGDGAYAILAAPGGPLAHTTLPGPSGAPRDPRRCPPQPPSTSYPQPGAIWCPGRTRPSSLTSAWALRNPGGTSESRTSTGPSGAQGGSRRPPPGFETVDLTADADTEEEKYKDEAPATPPPNISDSKGDMETDEKAGLLASPCTNNSSSDDDGFQHV